MENSLAALLEPKAQAQLPQMQADNEDEGTPVDTLVQWFEDAEEATTAARAQAERSRDYYDGKQLTSAEKKILRERGQPDIVINRIQPKINYLLGFEAENPTDPKAAPRTPADEEAAAAATDGLRYVSDKTDLDLSYNGIWENMLIEGYGGHELTVVDGPNGEKEFEIIKWDWDRLFYDPHSRKPDFSDARYLGGVVWMDYEDAVAKWPDSADVMERTWGDRTSSQTYDDKPIHQQWTQTGKRKRIRIVQIYHKEGEQWIWCVFTKGGKLESTPVPFVDQDGRSWCPMLLQAAFVDRDNNRYGLVCQMMGVQDEINKRRSKSLHRITMRQIQSERGAVDDVEIAKREIAKPDGWIETNPGFAFNVLDNSAQFAGEIQLLQHAQNEIELMGPNSAMQGKQGDAPSGRAIMANQNGGQTEIGVILKRLMNLKRRTNQRIWDLIRQYKTEEWWVRVTDNEENIRFVGFNRPVTFAEDMEKKMLKQGMQPDEIQARLQQIASQPGGIEALQQTARMDNVPSQMYMDITVEQAPSVANVMQEQFDSLIKLAPAVTFPPEVYLMASSLRNKRELLEKMKGAGADPVAAEAQKIQLEQAIKKAEAEIEKLRAEANKINVDADMAMLPLGVINQPLIEGPNGQPQQDLAQQDLAQPNSANGEGVPAAEVPPGAAMQNVPPTM